MPRRPNYDFEKRRKELARKQRQEEKRIRKRQETTPSGDAPAPLDPSATPDSPPGAPAE